MTSPKPVNHFNLWQSESLFGIDFASYSLSHHDFQRHFHDHYVVELVISGIDRFYCSGKTYNAVENDIVLINPGEVHTGSTVMDHDLQYFSFYPGKHQIEEISKNLELNISGDFVFSKNILSNENARHKFSRLAQLIADYDANEIQREEVFFELMADLLGKDNFSETSALKSTDKRLSSVIDFIRTEFKNEISLKQLAQIANLNPSYFVRLFKRQTGLSPYDYLLITRIDYAWQLLRRNYSVQEAALEAGFYDSSHFNRLFKKTMGSSPKLYRMTKSQYHTIFN